MFILLLLCDFASVLAVNKVTLNFSRGFEFQSQTQILQCQSQTAQSKAKAKATILRSQSHDVAKPEFWL